MTDYSEDDLSVILSLENSDLGLDIAIESVAVLFSERALPYLLVIMQSHAKSWEIRQKTALAIRDIGAESVVEPLSKLQNTDDPKLRELAALALFGVNNPKN